MAVRPAGTFKTTYAADMALLDTRFDQVGFALLLLALLLAPWWLGRYLFLLNAIGIFAIGAVGLSLLTGFGGQISLGHAAFMAVGAYTSWLLTQHGIPFLLALPLAGGTAFAFGAVVGLPSLRIKGLYLAIATLAFQFVLDYVIVHAWGAGGGNVVIGPSLFGYAVRTERQFYYLLLPLWLGAGIFAANLVRGRVGLALMAIRDRDYAAQVLGVPLLYYKTLAFALAAFYAGVAGSLFAHYNRVITNEHFTIGQSIDYIAMVVLGGLGSVWGPHLGAALVISLTQVLKILTPALVNLLPAFGRVATPLREVVFGALLIGLLIWEPGGLAMLCRKLKRYLDLWPFPY
ncbi:MAG: branched-chain amino acid ABC transporter permease [Armatimonadota bacterium]|nr:branched-chain amino acid ABC transporter permease [Armatimonadota bacterium]MDR7447819.1 branched-chain amino acid ABC transporter permease [Armatimonadota bacterium]MDR7479832.1 branched-chain amino acid ABC transporter permease [Armatimonadota bacterium]MDR7487505.1 branched-chain amino acid ABC transporter permease [Armatimonadota bacterium]MDR7490310.1 branched-chain amino acid ABC transporter permease [Armatimonadota bacterium]